MSAPISVTPRARPLSITLASPEWDATIVLYDLDEARAMAHRVLDAVQLLEHTATGMGRKGGKIGGRSTSAAKTAASRANGRKGGRPPKARPP